MWGSAASPSHAVENMSSLYYGEDKDVIKATLDLKHEQDRIQKRTFTKWFNSHLSQIPLFEHPKAIPIENLIEDLKDGTQLCNLIEVLTGDKLRINRGTALKRVHHLSNLRTALETLKQRGLDLVNNNATDIADGNENIVLGLVWQIILHFQIEENARLLADWGWSLSSSLSSSTSSLDSEPSPSPLGSLKRFKPSLASPLGPASRLRRPATVESVMLKWLKKEITENYGLGTVKDFDRSWKDGVLFNALVHRIQPDLVDLPTVKKQAPRVNLQQAFDKAETNLGIARLLEVEDVDCERPDKRSIMTYVSQFLKRSPHGAEKKAELGPSRETEEREKAADLEQWLAQARDRLQQVDQPLRNFYREYEEYLGLREGYLQRRDAHRYFAERASRGTASLSPDAWRRIDAQ